jgi:ParB family chromosome partitioning protein
MQLELQELDTRYEKLRRRAPRREERLLSSLASAGQQTPVVVITAEAGRHVLLDGYKRVRALTKLREDVVTATQWSLPEKEALILERLMRTSEEIDALEQGWLLDELHTRFEMSEEELAQRFDKSKSWVSRRLGLVTVLPETVQERVLDGLLGAHAAMKFLLPLARANEAHCLALVKALGSRKPSTREMESLYRGLTEGSVKARELVLSNPWLYLRAEAESARSDDRKRTPAEVLLGDVGAVGGIARRTRAFLDRQAAGLDADERRAVLGVARQAQDEAERLFRKIDEELGHAR